MHVPESERAPLEPALAEAEQQLERRRFRQAVACYDRALAALGEAEVTQGRADQEAEIRLSRAEVQMQLGRWPKVTEDVDAVLAMDGELRDGLHRVRARLLSSRIHGYCGHYEEAVADLRDALQRAEKVGEALDRAQVCLELGALHNKVGQHEEGQRELLEARSLAGGPPADARSATVAAMLLVEEGLAHFRQGRSDDARRAYDEALALARRYLPKTQLEADVHRQVGIVCSVQGRYVEALHSHEKALGIYRELESLFGQAKVYGSIGQVCLELARVDEALFALNKARRICVKLGADAEKASLYGRLGTIYREREEFDRAVEFHLKDVELARRLGNQRGLAFAFRNLGLSYRARGEGDEARSYLRESMRRFEALGDVARAARVRLDMAEIWLDQGRAREAQEELDASREALEARKVPLDLGRMHLLRGILNRELRHQKEAGEELLQAVQVLSSQPSSALLAEAHFELARLYQLTAEPDKAVDQLRSALMLARQHGLAKLAQRVVGLLEVINEVEIVRLLVEDVERESAGQAPGHP